MKGPIPNRNSMRSQQRLGNPYKKESIPVEVMTPPSDLRPAALEFWSKHSENLQKLNLLDNLTLDAFVKLCNAHADMDEADTIVRREGLTSVKRSGMESMHPAYKLKCEAFKIYNSLCQQFALTPAARLRLGMSVETPVQLTNKGDNGRHPLFDD